SLLTVQRQTQQIETSREIYEANIRIYGQPQSRRIMNRSVTPDDADKTGKLVESFIVHRGFYDEVIDGIYSNPKIGTFTARRFLLFYSAQHPRLNTTSTIHTFSSCRVQKKRTRFINVWDKRLGAFQQRLTSVYNAREKTKNLNLHTLKCMVRDSMETA
ncbi:uncharacterized protein LOC113470406, partial [Diaphorina citri]|uniref:Uncharacterized protein LOC113470406 n=1 Tax=Diaphorina citri TaxID=121845 RepID=A0A3Q0J816_DIACI